MPSLNRQDRRRRKVHPVRITQHSANIDRRRHFLCVEFFFSVSFSVFFSTFILKIIPLLIWFCFEECHDTMLISSNDIHFIEILEHCYHFHFSRFFVVFFSSSFKLLFLFNLNHLAHEWVKCVLEIKIRAI